MNLLNYKNVKNNYNGFLLENGVERVLQFGEGNFLRAFIDYYIDVMNEKANFNTKVVVVKPTDSKNDTIDKLNAQNGLYTLFLRGRENGIEVNKKRVISCISRCINPYDNYDLYIENAKNKDLRFIVSNTTEAGIVFDENANFDDRPAKNFPAKLCQFLYKRYEYKLNGFIILSLELIDHNGDELKRIINLYIDKWKLGGDFKKWVNENNEFHSTLVDRIVTGYPKEEEASNLCNELKVIDNVIDTAETFSLFVIEGDNNLYKEIPIKEAGLDKEIIVVNNHMPYKKRKVRILNGAHTSIVLGGYLSGFNIVRELMNDKIIHDFMDKIIYEEVIPTINDLDENELIDFAKKVTDRFNNPYISHQLLSIALNSTAKWKARVMPSLLDYVKKFNKLPKAIVMSFALYIFFYHTTDVAKDEQNVIDFYVLHKKDDLKILAKAVIDNEKFWGDELKKLNGFYEEVVIALEKIEKLGVKNAIKSC